MISRQKIAIIGADASGFHIFNTIYRSDDRYEVAIFINPSVKSFSSRYPAKLAGSNYPAGIPIMSSLKFQEFIKNNSIEKCIFSHYCVTSSQYLNLAAQCLAAGCTVLSHSLESTRLNPPKPLVTFSSDTQFDIPILIKILSTYKASGLKPIVAFYGIIQGLAAGEPFQRFNSVKDFEKISKYLTDHQRDVCEAALRDNFSLIFLYDFDQFCQSAIRDSSFDIVVVANMNNLPCFFRSHLQIHAFDDFTFGQVVSQHPSSIIAEQANILIHAHIKDQDCIKKLLHKEDERKVVEMTVTYSAKDAHSMKGKKCLLVDDPYPTTTCCAVHSISKHIAEFFGAIPVPPPSERSPSVGSIYFEPSEAQWPAMIPPETAGARKKFEVVGDDSFEIVASSTNTPIAAPEGKQLFQFSFKVDTSTLTEEVLELPAGAFVKQRLR